MYLKVNHRAAEVALERGNEERPYHRGNGCGEEEKPEIGKHALLDVVSQVFFNSLCEKRALKGICRARNERDDAKKRERYGNPASTNACDPNRVCQRSDHVNNKRERANDQQLSVHGSGNSRGRISLHAVASQAIARFHTPLPVGHAVTVTTLMAQLRRNTAALVTPNVRFPVPNFLTANSKQQTANSKQQTANSKQRLTNDER
jgi:hypothetical protein